MARLKTSVNRLLDEFYISHLWNMQQRNNPVHANVMDYHCKKLIRACKPVKRVLNHAKYRALIKLGILKSTTPISENDYFINVKLTHFGLIMCRKLLYGIARYDFPKALKNKHESFFSNPIMDFWDRVRLLNSYDDGYYVALDTDVFAQYVPLERFEKWILSFPNIKSVIPFINNRKKVEKYINMLFTVEQPSYDSSFDSIDDSPRLRL